MEKKVRQRGKRNTERCDSNIEQVVEKNENDLGVLFSPGILTENGVFDVIPGCPNAITQYRGELHIIDSMSFAVVQYLGTYPEAKILKVSPNGVYAAFITRYEDARLKVINLLNDSCWSFKIGNHFKAKNILWSPDSRAVLVISNLGESIAVYRVDKETILLEGPSLGNNEEPIMSFNFSGDCFTIVKNRYIINYWTETWTVQTKIYCIPNPIGLVYTDSYTTAVWNNWDNFVVYSLVGEQLFSRKSENGCGVKTATVCRQRRYIALATYDDKVEIYDIFSWHMLCCIEYPESLASVKQEICIWAEPTTPLYFQSSGFTLRKFDSIENMALKSLRNINDEFKLKSEKRFCVAFSSKNTFLACFTPGFVKVVLIINFQAGRIASALNLAESTVKGFQWHPHEDILAIKTIDSIIFWSESKVFAVNYNSVLKSFHWFQTEHVMCSIVTQSDCIFVSINDS